MPRSIDDPYPKTASHTHNTPIETGLEHPHRLYAFAFPSPRCNDCQLYFNRRQPTPRLTHRYTVVVVARSVCVTTKSISG